MLCQLGFLRGDALGNGLARVVGLPVAHNVVLPFLVGVKIGLGDVIAQSGFIGLVVFQIGDTGILCGLPCGVGLGFDITGQIFGQMLDGIGVAGDCGILRGVLGLDIRDSLLVGGVVTLKRGNPLLMVCQLGGMGRQLCGVLGNQLAVCQLCGLGAVDFSGQRGIGVVGLGVQLGEVGFGLFTALFQFVQPAVLLNVLFLNVGDCIPVCLDFRLILGKVRPETIGNTGEAFNGLMVCRDFLMLGGKTALMVGQLCGMVGQLVRVLGDVRGIVLNILGILGNVGGVLGDAGIVALELGVDTVQPGILLGVLGLKGGNVVVIAGNLPLKILVLGVQVGNLGGVLGGGGLQTVDFGFGGRHTLGQSVNAGFVLGHRVFHLGVVLGELVDFLPEFRVVRRKAGDLRRQVFHRVFVLLHLRIICAGLGPVPPIGDINAGAHVALARVAFAVVGHNGKGFIGAVNIPFDGVGENGNIPTADVLRRGTGPTGNRGPGRHRGMMGAARARPTGAGVSRSKGRGFDGETAIFLATHSETPFLIGDDKVAIFRFGDIGAGVEGQPPPVSRDVCTEVPVRGQPEPDKPNHFTNHAGKILVGPLQKLAVLKVTGIQTVVDALLCFGKVSHCGVQRGNIAALRFLPFGNALHQSGQALNLGDHPTKVIHPRVTGDVGRRRAKRKVHKITLSFLSSARRPGLLPG